MTGEARTDGARTGSDEQAKQQAVDALQRGEAVVLPTDTVFGLAVAPRFAQSPDTLYQLKGRSADKPIAWLVDGVEDLDNYGTQVPAYARRLARRYWPGPLTLVVAAGENVPPAYRSQEGTIGLRLPDDYLAREIIQRADSPLATTSANPSGAEAPHRLDDVDADLRNKVAVALDDAQGKSGTPSTVVDCTQAYPKVLREGAVTAGQVAAAVAASDATDAVRCTSFRENSTDGTDKLYARRWLPPQDTAVRGIVLIAHGMAEHAGRYDGFARFLAAGGLAVYAHDHVGHGRSVKTPAQWGCLPGDQAAKTMVDDMHKLRNIAVSEQPDGAPVVLFGHSMGSFIARAYLSYYGTDLAAAVISGTGQQPEIAAHAAHALATRLARSKGPDYRSAFLDGKAVGSYGKAVKNARTPNDWLSTDPAVVDAYQADPACGFMFSVGAYQALFMLVGYMSTTDCAGGAPEDLPVLFVGGAEDPVGDKGKGVRKAARILQKYSGAAVDVKIYPGMRHEVLNEVGYEQVWLDIARWIDEKGLAR